MIITTPDQRTIIFGRSEDIDNKLTILGALLKDGTPFTVLDLRPNTPYYRNDGPNQPAPAEPPPEP